MNRLKFNFFSTVFRRPEGEAGSEAPAGSPPASNEPSEKGVDYSMFDLGDSFDPAPQGREGAKEPAAGDPPQPPAAGGEEEGKAPVVGTEPSSEPPAPAPKTEAAPAGEDPKDALLKHLQAEVQRLTGERQQPKEPESTSTPTDPDEDFVKVYKNIPISDEILGAMASDDPNERRQVLAGLLGGVLTRAAKDARAFVREQVEALRTQVPTLATSTIETRSEAQRIGDDFFGAYPQYKPPGLQPAVSQAMQEVVQQQTAAGTFQGYTPAFREAVGQRLQALTGIPAQAAQQQQTTEPPAPVAQPKKTPFMAGGGGRAPIPAASEFADVLGD